MKNIESHEKCFIGTGKKFRSEIKLVKTICVHCLDPACQVSNFDDSQVHGQAYLNVFGLVLPQSLDV